MKPLATLLALSLALGGAAVAGPVQREQIPADTQWLIHLDADDFRGTQAGAFVLNEVLKKKLAQPLAAMRQKFKFEIDPNDVLDKIKSVTLYGADFQNPQESAVALIKTDPQLQTILIGVLAGMSLAGSNGAPRMEQTRQGEVTLYNAKDQGFIAVAPGKWVVAGKSKTATQKAVDTLVGKAPGLKAGNAFSQYRDVARTFFFLGVAEGFSAGTTNLPQARILQMADGGRVVLGENAGQLFVNLALRAKTAEVVTEMQQVIQGIIALASLTKTDDKELSGMIQSMKVTASDKTVSVSAEYPVDKAIQKLTQALLAQHKDSPENARGPAEKSETAPTAGPKSN